ncbi:MAG TPA: cytochrome C [Myxococcota bacterium]|nr:cytochrome C [Myxococcota bacterium]
MVKKLSFLVLAVVAGGVLYVVFGLPNVGAAPDLTIERTPERLRRGEYLVRNVAACLACHSDRDYDKLYAPPREGLEGAGGETWTEARDGVPGTFVAANLTPASLGTWTDGEILRALTTGVSRDGHALFPLMPYASYGHLDREDMLSIIAYVRTLPPIPHPVEVSRAIFPVNLILHTVPEPAHFGARPATSDPIAYGEYLVNMASCAHCHTERDAHGNLLEGRAFAGGNTFHLPTHLRVVSANLTPDKETGIGNWSRDAFIQRFRDTRSAALAHPEAAGFNSPMPWLTYGGMTDADLGAIYDYLRTRPAVSHAIPRGAQAE